MRSWASYLRRARRLKIGRAEMRGEEGRSTQSIKTFCRDPGFVRTSEYLIATSVAEIKKMGEARVTRTR